jgi:hypothetical protein
MGAVYSIGLKGPVILVNRIINGVKDTYMRLGKTTFYYDVNAGLKLAGLPLKH